MFANKRWSGEKDGNIIDPCPDDSMLLASMRQQLDNRQTMEIRRHIDVCLRCHQKYNALTKVNAKLDALKLMPRYQFYPELSAARTYQYIQQHIQEEERRRKVVPAAIFAGISQLRKQTGRKQQTSGRVSTASPFRLLSLPAALALCILFIIAMLAFAIISFGHTGTSTPGGGLRNSGPNSSLVAAHNATPVQRPHTTPVLKGTASVGATQTAAVTSSKPGPTPSPTSSVPQATIDQCTTADDLAQHLIRICGANFTPGDKVTLYVDLPGSGPKPVHPEYVDDSGSFQYTFTIYKCRIPIAIYAQDLTNKAIVSPVLQNITYGSCPATTPTPGPTGQN